MSIYALENDVVNFLGHCFLNLFNQCMAKVCGNDKYFIDKSINILIRNAFMAGAVFGYTTLSWPSVFEADMHTRRECRATECTYASMHGLFHGSGN